MASPGGVRPDGTFRDEYYIDRGYWEAKDSKDNLESEIKKKSARGYPLTNTIFEDTRTALLYQNGGLALKADLTKPDQLAELLNAFFSHTEPAHEDFEKAVDDFKERVPQLAKGLVEKIEQAHKDNAKFQKAFDAFYELCRSSLNPNLSAAAVDEMLVQHILTERLIRTIFDNEDFTHRNVIAAEVEKVIDALVSKSFNRKEFLKSLDRFYVAIENAAATIPSFTEKQHFLNTVYERFFQGYSVKVADTHGIVYTPQPIVDFMCASVVEVLDKEFGKTLGDKDVFILDPCTGTDNFIVNLLRRIPKKDLPKVYKERLFANEIMLLPYYIAALNIAHAYYELTKSYEPFEGLCFVDTLDIAEHNQAGFDFFTAKTSERVQRQRAAPITIIVGNPPYNMGQQNENDNNKNRTYSVIDGRIRRTYVKDSKATLKTKLYDSYVRFFRWAVDRLQGRDGVVCLVTNNSFVDQLAFDGMQKHLLEDFSFIYHVDLKGNVRRNPKLSGTVHNVFGIQVGVGITVAVKLSARKEHRLYYHALQEDWRKEVKLQWLSQKANVTTVKWQKLPTRQWLTIGGAGEYDKFTPIGLMSHDAHLKTHAAIFANHGLGVSSNRDEVVYDWNVHRLAQRMAQFCEDYNSEVDRYIRKGQPSDVDEFLDYTKVKWSDTLKRHLRRGRRLKFDVSGIVPSITRPFTKRNLYFDDFAIDRPGAFRYYLPEANSRSTNVIICCTNHTQSPFIVQISDIVTDAAIGGRAGQCFPFYIYDEDGSNQQENITDLALKQFRERYGDATISKWNLFHYVYGMLHHPGYREKFADNLKRELPRIPFAETFEDFCAFRDAGKGLAKLHLKYEDLKPWKLDWIEASAPGVPLSYRVEKMKLSKDKTSLTVNDSLTLGGIPPEVFEYRLGNRSALEWVIDQYQVSIDKRSGIESDPNRKEDPEYIVRLVGQVVRVSVETVKVVKGLPKSYGKGLSE